MPSSTAKTAKSWELESLERKLTEEDLILETEAGFLETVKPRHKLWYNKLERQLFDANEILEKRSLMRLSREVTGTRRAALSGETGGEIGSVDIGRTSSYTKGRDLQLVGLEPQKRELTSCRQGLRRS
jgi:hypothetical protein